MACDEIVETLAKFADILRAKPKRDMIISREVAVEMARQIDEALAAAESARSAHIAGQLAMRERCAGVVTENYQSLSTEHRLLLVNRATAIRSLEPEDVT